MNGPSEKFTDKDAQWFIKAREAAGEPVDFPLVPENEEIGKF